MTNDESHRIFITVIPPFVRRHNDFGGKISDDINVVAHGVLVVTGFSLNGKSAELVYLPVISYYL